MERNQNMSKKKIRTMDVELELLLKIWHQLFKITQEIHESSLKRFEEVPRFYVKRKDEDALPF